MVVSSVMNLWLYVRNAPITAGCFLEVAPPIGKMIDWLTYRAIKESGTGRIDLKGTKNHFLSVIHQLESSSFVKGYLDVAENMISNVVCMYLQLNGGCSHLSNFHGCSCDSQVRGDVKFRSYSFSSMQVLSENEFSFACMFCYGPGLSGKRMRLLVLLFKINCNQLSNSLALDGTGSCSCRRFDTYGSLQRGQSTFRSYHIAFCVCVRLVFLIVEGGAMFQDCDLCVVSFFSTSSLMKNSGPLKPLLYFLVTKKYFLLPNSSLQKLFIVCV